MRPHPDPRCLRPRARRRRHVRAALSLEADPRRRAEPGRRLLRRDRARLGQGSARASAGRSSSRTTSAPAAASAPSSPPVAARRLHGHGRASPARRRAEPVREPPVRPGPGLRADHPRRDDAERLVVHPSSPIESVQELVAAARQAGRPGARRTATDFAAPVDGDARPRRWARAGSRPVQGRRPTVTAMLGGQVGSRSSSRPTHSRTSKPGSPARSACRREAGRAAAGRPDARRGGRARLRGDGVVRLCARRTPRRIIDRLNAESGRRWNRPTCAASRAQQPLELPAARRSAWRLRQTNHEVVEGGEGVRREDTLKEWGATRPEAAGHQPARSRSAGLRQRIDRLRVEDDVPPRKRSVPP